MSKYERQERLSIWDQDIINSSTCLIAGVGGIGCEVAKNLALIGFGNLILVDNDSIEFSNLNRQLLFTENHIGKAKAEIAAHAIKRFNPDVNISFYTDRIQKTPMRIFEETDIIVGCFDNFLARVYLNEMAVINKKPLIDGASEGFFAQMTVYLPEQTACLGCFNPLPPDETLVLDIPCTLVGKPRRREHCGWIALYRFNQSFNRMPSESDEDIEHLYLQVKEISSEHGFDPLSRYEIKELLLSHTPSVINVNAVIAGLMCSEIIKSLYLFKSKEGNQRFQRELNNLLSHDRFQIPHWTIYSALTGTTINYEREIDPNCLTCSKTNHNFYEMTIKKTDVISDIVEEIKRTLDFKKDTSIVLFRGTQVIDNNKAVSDQIFDGDCLIISDLDSEIEKLVKFRFK